MAPIKKALSADMADEREGVRTYGQQARQFRASDPSAAKTVRSIQSDEKRHLKKLRTLRRSR